MDRTLRAALIAAVIGLVAVGGFGWLLGFPPVPSLVAGLISAVLFGGVVLAAARRSASFHDPGSPDGP